MSRSMFVAVFVLMFVGLSIPSYAQTVDVARLPGDLQPFEDQVILSIANGSSSASDPLPLFPRSNSDRGAERFTIETITIAVLLPVGQSPEIRYDMGRDGALPLFRQLALTRQGSTGSGQNRKARWTATLPVRLYLDSDTLVQSQFVFQRSGGTQGTASATITASGYITLKP